MIAISNETSVTMELSDIYSLGEFQGNYHRSDIPGKDWIGFLHGKPPGKHEGSYGAMAWKFKDYHTGDTFHFAFSWAVPWRGVKHDRVKNVISGYLKLQKP